MMTHVTTKYIFFTYAEEDAEAAELIIDAVLHADASLKRTFTLSKKTSAEKASAEDSEASAALAFVSDAFLKQPERLKDIKMINDNFGAFRIKRVVWLCLTPLILLERESLPQEISLDLSSGTRVDLLYGLETMTQARLNFVVQVLLGAVESKVVTVHCFNRECLSRYGVCFTLLLALAAVYGGLIVSLATEVSTYSRPVSPLSSSNNFIGNTSGISRHVSVGDYISCVGNMQITIDRLPVNDASNLNQLVCASSGAVISSIFCNSCNSTWQPWQLAAAENGATTFAGIAAATVKAAASAQSMLALNYLFMCATSLPMFLLMHQFWQGRCCGRYVPCCVSCARLGARRPLVIWAISLSLITIALFSSLFAMLLVKRDVQEKLIAWEKSLPGFKQEEETGVKSYADPLAGGGRIYIDTSSALVQGATVHFASSMAALFAMLLVLAAGQFCNRRGIPLLRHKRKGQISPQTSNSRPLTLLNPREQCEMSQAELSAAGVGVEGASSQLKVLPLPYIDEIIINPRLRVFLSHNWGAKLFLESVREKLDEHGINYWLDVRDMAPGDEMFRKLAEGLKSVDVLIAFIDFNYLQSANCFKEFEFARMNHVPIVVVALQGRIWREKYAWNQPLSPHQSSSSTTKAAHPFAAFIEQCCIVLDFTKVKGLILPDELGKPPLRELPVAISPKQAQLLVAAVGNANAMQVPCEFGGIQRKEAAILTAAILHAQSRADTTVAGELDKTLRMQGCRLVDLADADVVYAVLSSNFIADAKLVDAFVLHSSGDAGRLQRMVLIVSDKNWPLWNARLSPLTAGQQYIDVKTTHDFQSDEVYDSAALIQVLGKNYKKGNGEEKRTSKHLWPNAFEGLLSSWSITRSVIISGPRTERPVCMWTVFCCLHCVLSRQDSFRFFAAAAVFFTGLLALILLGLLASGNAGVTVSGSDCEQVSIPQGLSDEAEQNAKVDIILSAVGFALAFPLLQSMWLPLGIFGRTGAALSRATLVCDLGWLWFATAASLLGITVSAWIIDYKVSEFREHLNMESVLASELPKGNCVQSNTFIPVVMAMTALSSWAAAGCEARGRFICGGRARKH